MKMTFRRNRKIVLNGLFDDVRFRIAVIGGIFLIGFAVLWGRLYFVQVMSGKSHIEQVSNQSLRRIRIPNQRGRIITADNVVLADNNVEFDLVFYPEEMQQRTRNRTVRYMAECAARASRMVGRENKITPEDIRIHLIRRPGIPLTVIKHLDTAEAARALEFARITSGCDVSQRLVRVYPQKSLACHIIGYTGLEERSRAADKEDFFYYIPDAVGREGIEKAFDVLPGNRGTGLRGYPGYSLIQVDKLGYARDKIIHGIPPVAGSNVVLTLSARAQKEAEKQLSGYRGAIVLLDADNGDVLAAASAPGYDLSRFTPAVPADYYRLLRNDPANPLFNRAFSGSYTPGSIMKPVVMLALLSAGVDPAVQVDCDGASKIGNARIRCAAHRRGGHGPVDAVEALNVSCNDYMIENAVSHPAEILFEQMASAGIGRRSGVELPDSRGVLPSDAEKRRRFRFGWTKYDTALLSIGQGIISISPLQAAVICAALANGGTVYKPHLVREVVDNTGNVVYQRKSEIKGTLSGTLQAREIVRKGMFEVVNSSNGSGRRARVDGLEIYGKTGSAEFGRKGNLRIFAWFIAYTKHNGRNYAAAAIVEEGSSGGGVCAPMVGRFLRNYLLNQQK